jgi:diguanylate cyclase (GGDEF)-like protein/PAS domain S-box-containing protein
MDDTGGITPGLLAFDAALLDALPDGILAYGANGCCLLANQTAADLLGVPREELLRTGRDGSGLFDCSGLCARAEETVTAGHVTSWEGSLVSPQADTVWLHFRFSMLGAGPGAVLLVVFHDVTDTKRVEGALRLTQASVDRASDMVYWLGPDGRILYVNDSVCRRYGYDRQELLALTVMDLNPELTPETWLRRWSRIKAEGAASFEIVHRTKHGEVFPVEISANYVLHEGKEYNVSFVRDISERRRQAEEVQRAREAAERANRELERTLQKARELNLRLREAQRLVERQARMDSLTGTMNRRGINERLQAEEARSRRLGTPLGIGLIDVDHFKRINDRFGHLAGDDVLRAVAARLVQMVRPYDAVGRLGGEEFLVVMPETGPAEAERVLERLRVCICETPVEADGHEIRVAVSAGGASGTHLNADTLVRAADAALYRAKHSGRNRVAMAEGLPVVPAALGMSCSA